MKIYSFYSKAGDILLSILLTLFLFTGVMIGRYFFPIQKEVPISELKDRCEAAGGKYRFYWSDYSNQYSDRCEVVEDEIINY